MTAKMNEAMNSPEMKNLPPEVQKRMEAMMGGMMTTMMGGTGMMWGWGLLALVILVVGAGLIAT